MTVLRAIHTLYSEMIYRIYSTLTRQIIQLPYQRIDELSSWTSGATYIHSSSLLYEKDKESRLDYLRITRVCISLFLRCVTASELITLGFVRLVNQC